MNGVCACVTCSNVVTTRIKGFITPVQKDMLGYFCLDCVKAKCTHECKRESAA